jgi:serine/threonine protein kinase
MAPNTYRNGKIQYMPGAIIEENSTWSLSMGLDNTTGELLSIKQFYVTSASGISSTNLEELASCLQTLKAKKLDHEGLMPVYEQELKEESITIISTYAPGGSLQDMLKDYGSFAPSLARSAIRQILDALVYLHTNGARHGNLSTCSTFSTTGKAWIKLSNYGFPVRMLHEMASRSTRPSEIIGRASDVNWESVDVWSVGYLVLELLSGVSPWDEDALHFTAGESEETIDWSRLEPSLVEALGLKGRDFINSCLAK